MLDVKPLVVSVLSDILPVRYEYFLGDDVKLPLITYAESMNNMRADGDTIRWSDIGFLIKIYSYDLEEISEKAKLVDKAMFKLGFRRVSSNEMVIDTQIIKILNYEVLTSEMEIN